MRTDHLSQAFCTKVSLESRITLTTTRPLLKRVIFVQNEKVTSDASQMLLASRTNKPPRIPESEEELMIKLTTTSFFYVPLALRSEVCVHNIMSVGQTRGSDILQESKHVNLLAERYHSPIHSELPATIDVRPFQSLLKCQSPVPSTAEESVFGLWAGSHSQGD